MFQFSRQAARVNLRPVITLTLARQEVDDTPDFTESATNPNTTASSVAGDNHVDGRKKRAEANQLRRSIFGRKHDALGESKVRDIKHKPWALNSALVLLTIVIS